ncbi:4Fe4S-binding leucine-rich repeat protein [Hydrogenophaga sp.]|uniref:4Fe4S-binding leucine-rich repeat protein n=1 Tax=Hydrogenophaga sp. TaxID=1904254 RepID=UPI0035B08BBA
MGAAAVASFLARPQRLTSRAPEGDIPPMDWTGGPVDCGACAYADLRARDGGRGCEPGHACMQDAYARRIDRFFRWHPELSDDQLGHPYFEVRAIAARHASVFRLPGLMNDPDETVRMQVVLRLAPAQLERMVHDPHREVRLRVAQRMAPDRLAAMRQDSDYGVREIVAQRLLLALLTTMANDTERTVREIVARRLKMPALMLLLRDPEPEVRRAVAESLPDALLDRLADDSDWRVRWEVAQRAAPAVLRGLVDDEDSEVRALARSRLREGREVDRG